MKRVAFLFLLISLMLSSCNRHKESLPVEIIRPDSMVIILADFYLAEALANEAGFNQDAVELRKSFYKFIMNEHRTGYERIRNSIEYYSSRPEVFAEISEKVIEELSRRQAMAEAPLPVK